MGREEEEVRLRQEEDDKEMEESFVGHLTMLMIYDKMYRLKP